MNHPFSLHPSPFSLQGVERWLWYAFLVTLAWQTRLILWQADALFWEWQSASLWFSDVLMLALFTLALIGARGWWVRHADAADWMLGVLIAAGVLSLGHADSLPIGFYQLARLAQYSLLFLYVRHWAWHRFPLAPSLWAFVGGALIQAGLGIAQYHHQADIGLRFAGETLLRPAMRGVAVFYGLEHEKILRAYGTLPHPNVLAAYLMLASWGLAWLYRAGEGRRKKWLWAAGAAVLLWGMFLTYSRTVIAVWLVASATAAYFRRDFVRPLVLAVAIGMLFGAVHHRAVWARMTISAGDEAVQQRVRFASDAIASGGEWLPRINWTGVGIGNFTTWLGRWDRSLPRFMQQPAHSSYLLAYAETGLIGLLAFAVWLAAIGRSAWRGPHRAILLCVFGAVLTVAAMDHFFWTLQQGMLLWFLTLAVIAGGADDARRAA